MILDRSGGLFFVGCRFFHLDTHRYCVHPEHAGKVNVTQYFGRVPTAVYT